MVYLVSDDGSVGGSYLTPTYGLDYSCEVGWYGKKVLSLGSNAYASVCRYI